MARLADALHTADVVPPAAYYVPRCAGEAVGDLPIDRREFADGFTELRAAIDAAQVVVFDRIATFTLPTFHSLVGGFSPKQAMPPVRADGPFFLEARAPATEATGYDGMPRTWGYLAARLSDEEWLAFCRNVLKGTPEPGTSCLRLVLAIEIVKGQVSGPVANHYIPIDKATGDIVSDEWMSGYLPELPAELRPPASIMNPILSRMLMPALLAWALMDSPLAEFKPVETPAAVLRKRQRARRRGSARRATTQEEVQGKRPPRDYIDLGASGAEAVLRFDGMAGVEGLCAALARVRDLLVPPLKGVQPAYAASSRIWLPGMN